MIERKKKKVYGLNNQVGLVKMKKLGFNSRFKTIEMSLEKIFKLNNELKHFKVNKILQEFNKKNIEFLKNIRTYRGLRHRRYLPVRGQRTHTNAKTANKKYSNQAEKSKELSKGNRSRAKKSAKKGK